MRCLGLGRISGGLNAGGALKLEAGRAVSPGLPAGRTLRSVLWPRSPCLQLQLQLPARPPPSPAVLRASGVAPRISPPTLDVRSNVSEYKAGTYFLVRAAGGPEESAGIPDDREIPKMPAVGLTVPPALLVLSAVTRDLPQPGAATEENVAWPIKTTNPARPWEVLHGHAVIDCDLCRQNAPPTTPATTRGLLPTSSSRRRRRKEELCKQAMEERPVDAIGEDGDQ